MRRPKDWSSVLSVSSNSTKDIFYTVTGSYRSDASGEYTSTISSSITYRPTGYIQLSIEPTYLKELNTDQYQGFGNYDQDPEGDYLFSNSNLDIFYTEFRMNWSFTPRISLQTYARPLFYAADFSNFKTFEERKTYNFTELESGTQDAFARAIDFDYRVLQGNAVLRWEFRPGSTLFLIWQQEKQQTLAGQSFFEPFRNTPDLLKEDPTNIFLLKLSYWFGN